MKNFHLWETYHHPERIPTLEVKIEVPQMHGREDFVMAVSAKHLQTFEVFQEFVCESRGVWLYFYGDQFEWDQIVLESFICGASLRDWRPQQ